MVWKAGKKLGLKFAFFSALFWNNSIPKALGKSNLKVSTESYRFFCIIFCVLNMNIQGYPEENLNHWAKNKIIIASLIQYLVGARQIAKFFKSII